MKPKFKDEATEWLLEHAGHVPIGREVALARAFEAYYERGRRSVEAERDSKKKEEPC